MSPSAEPLNIGEKEVQYDTIIIRGGVPVVTWCTGEILSIKIDKTNDRSVLSQLAHKPQRAREVKDRDPSHEMAV